MKIYGERKKMKIYGESKEEREEIKTATENILRKLSPKYKKSSDAFISRKRAEKLQEEYKSRKNNTRRKPRM